MEFSKDKAVRYEQWFVDNNHLFDAEVEAIRSLITPFKKAIEIGVGTGLFASRLAIPEGVEPSKDMAREAIERGVHVLDGYAEALPLPGNRYDFVLMVTVDCFLSDARKAYREVSRILTDGGFFIIAFLDRSTPLGKVYQEKKAFNEFYKEANFHTGNEIKEMLREAGFHVRGMKQTIFSLKNEPQPVKEGIGEGLFAVIRAEVIEEK